MFSLPDSCVMHDLHLGINLTQISQRCSPITHCCQNKRPESLQAPGKVELAEAQMIRCSFPAFQVTRMSAAWSCVLKS